MKTHDLIQRLKDLPGPCREMDDLLWRWANENKRGVTGWEYDLRDAPAFTLSVDAALTLLPLYDEGDGTMVPHDFQLYYVNGGLTIFAAVAPNTIETKPAFGETAATALCRAVLEAEK